jgi:ribonucleoside-diphosphate reductase alpha chain
MLQIKKRITAFSVVKPGDAAPAVMLPDENPLEYRIERRTEGELPATCEKVAYSTQEGRKAIYVVISYMPVKGRIEGKEIVIERPIEFFLPIGQSSEDHQWVTATMRSLSLAARGGYAAKALQDMTQVSWNKGPVRCGKKDYGNNKVVPLHHKSEVAAIAWSIQQALYRRGFLDCEGNQVPAHKLAEVYQRRLNLTTEMPSDSLENIQVSESIEVNKPAGRPCSECGSPDSVFFTSGCDTCQACGSSKCG